LDVDTTLSIAGIALAVVLLLVITAAEFSVIYLSRSRARAMAERGAARHETLQQFTQERARLLSTLRFARNVAVILGTASALHLAVALYGAGWRPVMATGLLALAAVGLVEGIPEVIGARNPDYWGRVLAPITRALRLLFWLPSLVLDLPGVLLARYTPLPVIAPEDAEHEALIRLVEMEESKGGIEEEERQMIRGVFRLVDTTAREIMVPRIDVVAVEVGAPMEEVQRIVVERGFSRVPVYKETIDNIVGIVYAKDVLKRLTEGAPPVPLTEIARPPYFIPETKRVDELLAELRQNKVHIAIVVDEYGGTAGLVTTEDIIEEIVGEIEDEYDVAETPIERVNEDEAIVDARVDVDAINDMFDLELPSQEYDTVGGIVLSELGKMPIPGDEVRVDGIRLQVLSMLGRRIKKVRVTRLQEQPAETG
jgi:putative hemolysin